jgi:hypothetical protein
MKYFDLQNSRLVARAKNGGDITIQETKQGVEIFGRYTPHDNYMGHPFSDNLLVIIQLLKRNNIDYSLIESQKLKIGDHYLQIDTYLILSTKAFKTFEKALLTS